MRLLDSRQLSWRFADQSGGPASYWIRDRFAYGTHINVDPFPGYAHDVELVESTLEQVSQAFPLPDPFAPTIALLSHEVLSRTNGQTHLEFDYRERKEGVEAPWHGLIVLSAKRIPIHPGMTRYLVAHEYGHVVEDWLIRQLRVLAQ